MYVNSRFLIFVNKVNFKLFHSRLIEKWAYLWGHGQVCEGWLQVKGQRLAGMAGRRDQLLMGHRLELGEVAHWGMIVVWRKDALREAPPVICTATEGVNTLVLLQCETVVLGLLTFIKLSHIGEVGVELCRRPIILRFSRDNSLWILHGLGEQNRIICYPKFLHVTYVLMQESHKMNTQSGALLKSSCKQFQFKDLPV